MSGSPNSQIALNGGTKAGIDVKGSDGTVVALNSLTGIPISTDAPIQVAGAVRIIGNRSSGEHSGIELGDHVGAPTGGAELVFNRVEGNDVGVRVFANMERARPIANLATRNGTGFLVDGPGAYLNWNLATHNSKEGPDLGLGFLVRAPVTDGGHNTAYGNEDPRQCVGIRCLSR